MRVSPFNIGTRERCDHCKKFVTSKSAELVTLYGLCDEDLLNSENEFSICERCADKDYGKEYWNKWIRKKRVKKTY